MRANSDHIAENCPASASAPSVLLLPARCCSHCPCQLPHFSHTAHQTTGTTSDGFLSLSSIFLLFHLWCSSSLFSFLILFAHGTAALLPGDVKVKAACFEVPRGPLRFHSDASHFCLRREEDDIPISHLGLLSYSLTPR